MELVKQHFISILAGLIPLIILQWYINPNGFYDLLFSFDVVILFYFANQNEKIFKHRNYLIITLVLCVSYIFCVSFRGYLFNINLLLKILLASLLAFSFLYNKINVLYMKIAHIYVALFCIFSIWNDGYVPFESASINMVSIIVILYASTINFIELYNTQNISVLPSVVSVVACFFSDSRNGAITSIIYFVIVIALTWHNKTKYHRFFLSAFSALVVYYLFKYISVLADFNIFTRFDYKGLDLNERDVLWQGYLSKVDFISFLFGVDYQDVPEIATFGENSNPHSSFIQAHNKFGVIGLALLLSLFLLICKMLKNKKYTIFAIIIVVMLRSFTDSVFFVGMFDYFVFMLVLLFDSEIYNRCTFIKQTKQIKNH